jgi:hypothetical protein
MIYEFKNDSNTGEKADIETFLITEDNRTQTALYAVWCSVHCDCVLCMDSFSLITYKCVKDSNTVEKADVETFEITEGNRIQTALYNQKLSILNISSATGYPHIFFVGSIKP